MDGSVPRREGDEGEYLVPRHFVNLPFHQLAILSTKQKLFYLSGKEAGRKLSIGKLGCRSQALES
jgi:hypothetical protein